MRKPKDVIRPYVGETKLMYNQLKATITVYRDANDIDIRFEDGVEVIHKAYSCFKSGHIQHPDRYVQLNYKAGGEYTLKDGNHVKVIGYHGARNIDVEWDDGTVLEGADIRSLKNGTLRKPAYSHIGDIKFMKDGQRATIIDMPSYDQCQVQFEDGTITTTTYTSFRNGATRNPNVNVVANHLYERKVQKNDEMATIIGFSDKNPHIAKIQFDSGAIKHAPYSLFKKGLVQAPAKENVRMKQNRKERLGETNVMLNGMTATITRYGGRHDIDVTFEDGVTATHRFYEAFKAGKIAHSVMPMSFGRERKTKEEPQLNQGVAR